MIWQPFAWKTGIFRCIFLCCGLLGKKSAARRWFPISPGTGAVAATMPSDAFVSFFLYGKTGYADLVLAMEDGEAKAVQSASLLQRYAGGI